MNNPYSRLGPGLALCLPLLALAQAGRIDPADAKAPAPALRHQSAFADYKPWQEITPAPWRAVNDNVRDAGGAKGPAGPAGHAVTSVPAAPPAPAPKASAPSVPAHGGHHMHGGRR